jgi:hypothetical protein
MKVQIIPLP